MGKTWIIASGMFALGAVTFVRRWLRRRRAAQALPSSLHALSSEWLANERGRTDETQVS